VPNFSESHFHVSMKTMFLAISLLIIVYASADTHIDKKVAVKEVVFDSPVADLIWLEPDDRVVLARTTNGTHSPKIQLYMSACRSII
jgi:hypothetical protein